MALIGHSIGGNVGQDFILRWPERCAAALFLGCACSTAPLNWAERLLLKITPAMPAAYPLGALRSAVASGAAVTRRAQERYLAMLSSLSKAEIVAIFSQIVRGPHPQPGHHIACPILIADGAKDNLGNIQRAAAPWAARGGAPPPVVIRRARHLANMDNSKAFNRLMMDFLAGRYPVPGG
jgi:3-oxoadipate enol-lactonase